VAERDKWRCTRCGGSYAARFSSDGVCLDVVYLSCSECGQHEEHRPAWLWLKHGLVGPATKKALSRA
jgi:hypothetical protein